MQRNKGDMIIYSSTYASFESSATVEPRQRISNIYIYLYVSDQSVFIGCESNETKSMCSNCHSHKASVGFSIHLCVSSPNYLGHFITVGQITLYSIANCAYKTSKVNVNDFDSSTYF